VRIEATVLVVLLAATSAPAGEVQAEKQAEKQADKKADKKDKKGDEKTPQRKTGGGQWMDGERLENWNKKGDAIPAAPKEEMTPIMAASNMRAASISTGPCSEQLRKPFGPEDKAVMEAGWGLFGSLQIHSGIAVMAGASGADGMCRPLHVQYFVFADGHFIGTLSPQPMQPRSDGMLLGVNLYGQTLRATYQRYSEKDPLCCPSRESQVLFKVDGKLAVPESVQTHPLN
jgi:hypothetical protein